GQLFYIDSHASSLLECTSVVSICGHGIDGRYRKSLPLDFYWIVNTYAMPTHATFKHECRELKRERRQIIPPRPVHWQNRSFPNGCGPEIPVRIHRILRRPAHGPEAPAPCARSARAAQ